MWLSRRKRPTTAPSRLETERAAEFRQREIFQAAGRLEAVQRFRLRVQADHQREELRQLPEWRQVGDGRSEQREMGQAARVANELELALAKASRPHGAEGPQIGQ